MTEQQRKAMQRCAEAQRTGNTAKAERLAETNFLIQSTTQESD